MCFRLPPLYLRSVVATGKQRGAEHWTGIFSAHITSYSHSNGPCTSPQQLKQQRGEMPFTLVGLKTPLDIENRVTELSHIALRTL